MTSTRIPGHWRLLIAVAVGLVVFAALNFLIPYVIAALAAACCGFAVFIASVLIGAPRVDAAELQRRIDAEATRPLLEEILTVATAVAGLVMVAWLLHANPDRGVQAIGAAVGLVSVVMSWAMLHTMYARRYAHTYYTRGGGLDFHSGEDPGFVDFVYFSFTIGMTFAVSDTEVNTTRFRSLIIRHALLSFLFSTTILGALINVIAALL